MRIASYNIKSGGFDDYEYASPAPQKLPQLQAAFRRLDADILCLIDTFRWDEIYSEADLRRLFGYAHAACINLDDDRLRQLGHNNGITILSRQPLAEARAIALPGRNALYARVNLENGSRLQLAATYLDDLSEDQRLHQIQALLKHIADDSPAIICGDLNTFAPSDRDRHEPAVETFLENHPLLADTLSPVLSEMARAEVITQLLTQGYADADSARQPTFPSPLFSVMARQPLIRLDYCLYKGDIALSDVTVGTGQPFDTASDHYPLVFTVT